MSQAHPAESSVVDSTTPPAGAIAEAIPSNLDAQKRQILEKFNVSNPDSKIAVNAPIEDAGDADYEPEVSTDDEARVDGELDLVEASEEEDYGVEEVENAGEIPEDVDLRELMDSKQGIVIDGVRRSATDIHAAFRRQSKQNEAEKKVEDAQAELDKRSAALDEKATAIEVRKAEVDGNNYFSQFKAQLDKAQSELQQAAMNKDKATYDSLKMRIDAAMGNYNAEKKQFDDYMRQHGSANDEYQRKMLAERGYSELMSDTQRWGKLEAFVKESYSPRAFDLISNNAELIIMAENDRLYRNAKKSGATSKKRKSGRPSFTGGASSPLKPKPKLSEMDIVKQRILKSKGF